MQSTITVKGQPLKLNSPLPKVGDKAPDCELTDGELKSVRLSSFKGTPLLIMSVPSLDTSVCSLETARFNKEIAVFQNQVQALTISMDLPFAQTRWCAAENVKNLKVLSDYKKREFGEKFGVLIPDLGLLARAVFICDQNLIIKHVYLVKELTEEPDYKTILFELKQFLAPSK